MNSVFRDQARGAFVRGRLRESAMVMLIAALLVLVGTLCSPRPEQALLFGALLLLTSGAFAFVGRDAGRAVLPAMLLGSLPLACALVGPHLGHVCTGSACISFCVPFCSAGGLVAGILLERFSRAQRHPWRTWAFGVIIGACAGAMGCACVGMGGILGMSLGLVSPRLVRGALSWT
jgi:hypothetical protein